MSRRRAERFIPCIAISRHLRKPATSILYFIVAVNRPLHGFHRRLGELSPRAAAASPEKLLHQAVEQKLGFVQGFLHGGEVAVRPEGVLFRHISLQSGIIEPERAPGESAGLTASEIFPCESR